MMKMLKNEKSRDGGGAKHCDKGTETHRDWEFLWLSRPRLIETGKFCDCRDRDSSRLGISVVVETETSRD